MPHGSLFVAYRYGTARNVSCVVVVYRHDLADGVSHDLYQLDYATAFVLCPITCVMRYPNYGLFNGSDCFAWFYDVFRGVYPGTCHGENAP